jgi:ABC-type sulfate transport system permease subunit
VTPTLAETGFNGGTAFAIAGGLIVLAVILFVVRAVLAKRRKANG